MTSTPSGSLSGIRVLDLTRVLSGPYCTQILADHGAEVIKVERPGKGDDTRAFGPPFIKDQSAYFLTVNRNKKSVAVNLKSPEGAQLVKDLAKTCDVVVENFRPGAAERLGLGAEALRAENPRLIYCSISGFGQTGPWRSKPGYDLAVQGLSGIQSLTGNPEGPPTKVGTSIADIVTGIYAAQGVLLALVRRAQTGEGDVVDMSMLDSMISLLSYQAGNYFATGQSPTRRGNQHPNICPYETFQTLDGYLNLAVGNDRLWQHFCALLERPDLEKDPRFATNPDRVAHRDELFPILSGIMASRTTADWVEALQEAKVPCGPIHSVGEVLSLDVVKARQMLLTLDHPSAGPIEMTGVPIKLQNAPGSVRTPPPLLGANTREVFSQILGKTDEELDALFANEALA